MAHPTSESLKLPKVNSSKTRSARTLSTNDYKGNQLSNFGFAERANSQPVSLHNSTE